MRLDVLARLGADDDLVLLRGAIHPGRFVPLHSHADPECLFVIDGAIEVYHADRGWTEARAEEAVNVTAGLRHAVRNTGGVPSYVLTVTTVRMARFLAAIGAPEIGPEPHPPRLEEFVACSRRGGECGLWIASRDENTAIGIRG